jgi:hypothetical protein
MMVEITQEEGIFKNENIKFSKQKTELERSQWGRLVFSLQRVWDEIHRKRKTKKT